MFRPSPIDMGSQNLLSFGLLYRYGISKSTLLRTFIKNVSFFFPTDVGSQSSLPFEAQHSHLHSFPSPIDVGPSTPSRDQPSGWHIAWCPPLWGSATSLTHRLVSNPETIYNGSSPPLANIILFGPFFPNFPPRF